MYKKKGLYKKLTYKIVNYKIENKIKINSLIKLIILNLKNLKKNLIDIRFNKKLNKLNFEIF